MRTGQAAKDQAGADGSQWQGGAVPQGALTQGAPLTVALWSLKLARTYHCSGLAAAAHIVHDHLQASGTGLLV